MKKIKWFVKESVHLTRTVSDFGWGNGYVCIPKGHPAYGLDYDDVYSKFPDAISVNGGLTFAAPAKKLNKEYWPEIPKECMDCWILGFDTAHWGDTLSKWPKVMVEAETKNLAKQFEKLSKLQIK